MNLSEREIDPNNTGKIQSTLRTSRPGKLHKSINVTSNDPNNNVVRLTLIAEVISEISVTPDMTNFGEMKKDEKKSEKFVLKNTTKTTLEILPIEIPKDNLTIEPVTEVKKWPVVLKPEESIDLKVSYIYNTESTRISQPVTIKYTGGEATDVSLRVTARLHPDFINKTEGAKPVPSQKPKVIHSLSGKVPPSDQQPQKPLNIIAPTPSTNEQDNGNTP